MAKHDHGDGVITYDSFEEMQEDMAARHKAAVENTVPLQKTIELGGYACNVNHLREVGPIFGAIQSAEECRAWHQIFYGTGDQDAARAVLAERNEFPPPDRQGGKEAWEGDGFDSAEAAVTYYVSEHIHSFTEGYLFGNWLSPACPEGELGSGHASVCVPISREAYLDGKEHGGYMARPETAVEINDAIMTVFAQHEQRSQGEGDDNPDR